MHQDVNAFVLIRHLPQAGAYEVLFGRSELEAAARGGPRFSSLDEAIAWVDMLDRNCQGTASRPN